jgi:molybdopterin-binding protein
MKNIAELQNVSKAFNGSIAVNNVSLQVHEGEILALLGPNGAGKTTLLKILAFIDEPSAGDVYFQETKMTRETLERARRKSTMVFQRTVLFNTSVYDNVAYGLKVRRIPKTEIDKQVKSALKLVRLEGFENRHAKQLSGGEQQRVALARALVLNTRLLLLDEPSANLDPKNAAIVEEVITTANRELRATIIIATHNMLQARKLPHRIALMEEGQVTEIGTTAEIFGRLSKTLASFAVTDNVFTGTARLTDDGTALVDIGNGVHITATSANDDEVTVFISPEDIILSKERFESSARNVFRGKITEIQDAGTLVRLKVDVGKTFIVQITKRSFNEMKLNLGAEVFLAFKASSVQLV